MTHTWTVKAVSGVAGGSTREATVHLRVDCESDTVEEVRALAASAPDLLAACQLCLARDDIAEGELGTVLRAAIDKAEGR